ncbi:MAG TPA: hypothetical protein VMI33_04320 [Streptosporangiaceae bacterium]|nr:hypothetical protein [Streptosporangiaceae bacterium]
MLTAAAVLVVPAAAVLVVPAPAVVVVPAAAMAAGEPHTVTTAAVADSNQIL